MPGVDRRVAPGHPVAGDEERPVEAAAVVRHEPGVRRDVRLEQREERRARPAGPGRSSWACRNRSPSHQPSPTRNAIVPAAVASPVVSVSRQTSGTSGGGWPGQARRGARDRAAGRPSAARSGRPAQLGSRTSSPSTRLGQPLAERRSSRDRRRRRAIAGLAAVGRERRPVVREPPLERRTAHAGRLEPTAARRRARRGAAARAPCASTSGSSRGPVQAGQPRVAAAAADQLRRRRRSARRGAPRAAPTARSPPGTASYR